MSELKDLKERVAQQGQQLADLTARLAHLESHARPLPHHQRHEAPANGPLTSRLDHWYLTQKPSLATQLRAQLASHYATLAQGDNLARGVTFDGQSTIALADLPKAIAASLTRETIASAEFNSAKAAYEHGRGGEHRMQRLSVELEARKRHTLDLLASTDLPPIPAALAAKVKALAQPQHPNPWG
jgi:hypothetical protein